MVQPGGYVVMAYMGGGQFESLVYFHNRGQEKASNNQLTLEQTSAPVSHTIRFS